MKLLRLAVIVGAVALFMSPSLKAGTVTFDFTNCLGCPPVNNPVATTETYQIGSLIIVASGFDNPTTPRNLYIKNLGAGETGLGTTIDTADHEVTEKDWVNLDMSSLAAQGIFSGTLLVESIQTMEGYSICDGATVGALGSSCLSTHGFGGPVSQFVPITWSTADPIISVQGINDPAFPNASGADVLIGTLTTQTPEPATLSLLGMGLFGLASLRRKTVKK